MYALIECRACLSIFFFYFQFPILFVGFQGGKRCILYKKVTPASIFQQSLILVEWIHIILYNQRRGKWFHFSSQLNNWCGLFFGRWFGNVLIKQSAISQHQSLQNLVLSEMAPAMLMILRESNYTIYCNIILSKMARPNLGRCLLYWEKCLVGAWCSYMQITFFSVVVFNFIWIQRQCFPELFFLFGFLLAYSGVHLLCFQYYLKIFQWYFSRLTRW